MQMNLRLAVKQKEAWRPERSGNSMDSLSMQHSIRGAVGDFAAIEQSAGARMRGVTANGPFIKKRRRNFGLTQEGLATAARCDIKTIYRAENGARLDMATLERLAEALHVPYRIIVKESGDD
jgi:hypothetical protein